MDCTNHLGASPLDLSWRGAEADDRWEVVPHDLQDSSRSSWKDHWKLCQYFERQKASVISLLTCQLTCATLHFVRLCTEEWCWKWTLVYSRMRYWVVALSPVTSYINTFPSKKKNKWEGHGVSGYIGFVNMKSAVTIVSAIWLLSASNCKDTYMYIYIFFLHVTKPGKKTQKHQSVVCCYTYSPSCFDVLQTTWAGSQSPKVI